VFEVLGQRHRSTGEEVYCDRYATWEQAVQGHEYAVEVYRRELWPTYDTPPPAGLP
jgi:hypothetical protein